jgi:hypothetical protein
MGLKNLPSVFQSCVKELLQDLAEEVCFGQREERVDVREVDPDEGVTHVAFPVNGFALICRQLTETVEGDLDVLVAVRFYKIPALL